MLNKKEYLADFVIKNLIFIMLFVILSFYGISFVLAPQIRDFQEKQSDFRNHQFLEAKIKEKNQQIQNEIIAQQKHNKTLLSSLQTNISAIKIQTLAQNFFQSPTVTEKQVQQQGLFKEKTFELQALSDGIKNIFDFSQKIQETMPNATFIIPFSIHKQDPLSNSLSITISIKITQLQVK